MELEPCPMSQVSAFEFAKSSGNNSTTLEPRHGAKFLFTKVSIDSDRQERAIREVQELNSPTSFRVVVGSFLETLFREVSDRYYPLDEDIFRDCLKSWNSSSFFMLEKAALGLSGDVNITLQFSPPEYNPTLDSLKNLIVMSFDSVVDDYSQPGNSLVALLDK
ncbi:uncharacterized protein EAF02_010389 [Botrytis sinoallii]|uniref:uncharacterized protein n=1 Tax=Botrytis sinoallii TaxID=1463999 RepID=UPI0018FF48F5|nr:uncharacterized protein EAF02_010389 [Botrytis sinoallii]KAF7862840.1 hypothetical protein EAF02_010389 [Botrytis sinoallii]